MLMENRVSILTSVAAQKLDGCPYENDREPDISSLLAFWKENKYPLLSLKHANNSQEFWDLPEFAAAWDRQKSLLHSLTSEYVTIQNQWAQARIPYPMIKTGGFL
jgi:hypothetical protein